MIARLSALILALGFVAANEPSGHVIGYVTGPAGKPAAGAQVRLVDVISGVVLQTTQSDKAGRFSFAVPHSGTYGVNAGKPNGQCGFSDAFTIHDGLTVAVQLRMRFCSGPIDFVEPGV
jgi:hypothetical protein